MIDEEKAMRVPQNVTNWEHTIVQNKHRKGDYAMKIQTLHEYKVWVQRKHDEFAVIEDSGYSDLLEYVHMLVKNGGIYDPEYTAWIPYHRIKYIQQVKPK